MCLCFGGEMCITLCHSCLHASSILSKLIATVHLETKLPRNGTGWTHQVLIMSDSHSILSKQWGTCCFPLSYFITHMHQWNMNSKDIKLCCSTGKQNVMIPVKWKSVDEMKKQNRWLLHRETESYRVCAASKVWIIEIARKTPKSFIIAMKHIFIEKAK